MQACRRMLDGSHHRALHLRQRFSLATISPRLDADAADLELVVGADRRTRAWSAFVPGPTRSPVRYNHLPGANGSAIRCFAFRIVAVLEEQRRAAEVELADDAWRQQVVVAEHPRVDVVGIGRLMAGERVPAIATTPAVATTAFSEGRSD